jgi:isopentenyl phosphate kinase
MLYFLKLGGSLITDKNQPHTARINMIHCLAAEIASARKENQNLKLLLGHGSGSFGHFPAKKFGTRDGVYSPEGWKGFEYVWKEAHSLNQIIVDVLTSQDIPVISFPPSSMVIAENKTIKIWDLTPIKKALEADLIPLIYGDVIFDLTIGGTIFSTEELFGHLALSLKPEKILIAGIEEGVWQDFPANQHFIDLITQDIEPDIIRKLGGSNSVDVTGGMVEKVKSMRNLSHLLPDLEINIFSGITPGNVLRSLNGEDLGTRIRQS